MVKVTPPVAAPLDASPVCEAHGVPGEYERLSRTLAFAGIGGWELEVESGLLTLDATQRKLLGLTSQPEGPLPEHTVLAAIAAEDRASVREALHRALNGERRFDASFRVNSGNTARWLHSIGEVFGEGSPVRLVGVSFDTTAEHEALAARDVMLREMNHRIKNLFAVIGGMVAVCAREAKTVASFATEIIDRIAAMGRAHSLTQVTSVERTVTLLDLIEVVIAPTRTRQVVDIAGEPLEVPSRLVTPLALIFHEWATNAAKYGALADPAGSLSVSWHRDGAGLTTLEWCETVTARATTGPGQPGFGTRLIEATLAQIGARLTGSHEGNVLMRRITLEGL